MFALVTAKSNECINALNALLNLLYNGLVLPHLPDSVGDFEGCGNVTQGESLFCYQKGFTCLVAGMRGRPHANPFLAQHGMLKLGDRYYQQLPFWCTLHFWNGRLAENQVAMLRQVGDVHGYGTRAAGCGLFLSTRDHCSVGYRVPVELASLSEEQRGAVSLASFKIGSRRGVPGCLCGVCVCGWRV